MNATFKFSVGDKITESDFNKIGIIDMCAIDRESIEMYFVRFADGKGFWVNAGQLKIFAATETKG